MSKQAAIVVLSKLIENAKETKKHRQNYTRYDNMDFDEYDYDVEIGINGF